MQDQFFLKMKVIENNEMELYEAICSSMHELLTSKLAKLQTSRYPATKRILTSFLAPVFQRLKLLCASTIHYVVNIPLHAESHEQGIPCF